MVAFHYYLRVIRLLFKTVFCGIIPIQTDTRFGLIPGDANAEYSLLESSKSPWY